MTAIEIVLILIGLIFMIGSFFVSEKLSASEIHEMSELSQVEIKRILEKELQQAHNKINDKIEVAVDGTVDLSMEKVQRELEKETNEKIMAIDEFSNTVIESMNKTHNEIMFLYSMLNDKHASISDTAVELQKLLSRAQEDKDSIAQYIEEAESKVQKEDSKSKELKSKRDDKEVVSEAVSVMDDTFERIAMMEENQDETNTSPLDEKQNHNVEILGLHKQGKSNVEIAKSLGLGMGEVKLVLDLFREEEQ